VPGDYLGKLPEQIWYELMAGDLTASTTLAAAAHQALADLMEAESVAMATNSAGTAASGWQGAGGVAMLGSSDEFIALLEALVAWLQESSQAAASMAEAHHTAQVSMVPGPVSDANRVSWTAAWSTNWFGQNYPIIHGLDDDYWGHHLPTNISAMAGYEAVVLGLLGLLGVPPPFAPPTANPAAAAADAAMGTAESGSNAGMQAGLHSVQQAGETAGPAAGQTAAAPGEMAQGMGSVMPMMLGQLGQVGQLAGTLPQMAGQLPAMVGQVPQMAMGMMGPLASGFGSAGAGVGAEPISTASLSQTALPPGGLGAAGGGGGGGFGASGGGVMSSFTRPASSFNAPSPPKLPAGWSSVVEPPAPVAASTQPMSGGTGGLYGAPMGMGRGEGAAAEKPPARTMTLSGRPTANRGNDREN